jgi:outer membrane protein assembly factor BamD
MIRFQKIVAVVLALGLMASCSFRRKKYENPITKDTQQPDKVLFDKAVQDIEKGRYEVARITLNTLINTYDTSEFLAKAKLAIADSWFREGGSHGMAQAEAEYKDFILFYPTLEEAAESQEKICMIHFRQMEKPDRDMTHALRAEDECRQLLIQFPNSKFAPTAQQKLREIQEVIAEGEFRVGSFYHTKGSHPAAANRLQALVDHFPLYSQADQALWQLGDSYSRLGPRFRNKAGDAYTRIVRDYPLSPLTEEAKNRLNQLEIPIPEADPVALARMKYEQENYNKPGMMSPLWGVMKKSPNVNNAAKSGNPAMTAFRPSIPVSVPAATAGEGAAGTTDVTVSTVEGSNSALDTQPDARQNQPGAKPADAAKQPESEATSSNGKEEKKNGKQKKEKKQKS